MTDGAWRVGNRSAQGDYVTVCFLTSQIIPTKNLRVTVEADVVNNLRERSQVQIEKIMTFPRSKVRGPIGRLSAEHMRDVDRYLMIFFGLLPPIELAPSN